MHTQGIAAIAALLLQLHSCAAAPTPDTNVVEGAGEKRDVPFPTNVASFPAGGPSGFKGFWSELTERDAPAGEASPEKRSSTLEIPPEWLKPEDWTATTTDSAKRSLFSGTNWLNCPAIARRGGPIPKRCLDYPFHIGIPVWDEDATTMARARSAAPSVERRIAPACVPNSSGGCTKDTTQPSKHWPFDQNIPGVAAVPRDTSEKKRIVLQPGMEPIDTPMQIGDLTLHIGRSDSDSDEKRLLCPIIDRRSDGTVVRGCPKEESFLPLINKFNFTSISKKPDYTSRFLPMAEESLDGEK